MNDQAIRIRQEKGEKDHKDLNCLVAPVSYVAIKQIPVVRSRRSELVEYVEHVRELAVGIPHNSEPAILGRLRPDHWLRILLSVPAGELDRQVADILRVQRRGLPVKQVVPHEVVGPLQRDRQRQPEAGVVVSNTKVDALGVLRGRRVLAMLPHRLVLLPLQGVRPGEVLAAFTGPSDLILDLLRHDELVHKGSLIPVFTLEQSPDGL
mmetsp:Transcript_30896/g.67670  ORF Transcript_30896/g.67670 Transcript_30896/m.67670 type:complete len:208 (+) Transcript_30896:2264-2887(+)